MSAGDKAKGMGNKNRNVRKFGVGFVTLKDQQKNDTSLYYNMHMSMPP